MNSPLISTIIPAYNREQFIERAVQSVLAQTMADLEVIVVDDCSTDGTAGRAAGLAQVDSRVRLLQQTSNMGAQAARNRGIREARGHYIAFLDSDDEWLPEKLERQLSLFERANSRLGVVYAGFRQVYADGRAPVEALPFARGDVYRTALSGWIADMNTLLVRRDVLEKAGPLDESVRAFQEWALCIQLSKTCDFDYVSAPLAVYHLHGGASISTNLLHNAQGYLDVVNLYKQDIHQELGKRVLAGHYRTAGRLFAKAGDYEAARECFWQAIQASPITPIFWLHLGFAYLGPGFYPQAVRLARGLRPGLRQKGN
jgi:glycosyltransferase involved in cell wall biosynthesis